MVTNKLFTPNQYGFTAGTPNVIQLLIAVNSWTESNCAVDVIYSDLTKPFDSVPHICLLTKLVSYGLIGNLLG